MPELLMQAHGLAFRFPGQPGPLFEQVDLSIYSGEKVALLGTNGAGKTTLLELLLGRREPSEGEVVRPHGRVAHVSQNDTLSEADTVQDTLMATRPRLKSLHCEIAAAEAAGLPDPLRYAERVAAFHALGGFAFLAHAEKTLAGFGFPDGSLARPVRSLSGGELRRLQLGAALASESDLTLLDEPSNYLDAAGTEGLIEGIRNSPRAFLIVSHDRWFLDQAVDRVLELERGGLAGYRGNYSVFAATKATLRQQQVRQKAKLQAEIGKLQEMERSYKIWGARKEKEKSGASDKGFIGARAARLAKRGILAKERIAERADKLREVTPWIERERAVAFAPTRCPGGTCLVASGLGYAFGAGPLFDDLSVTLEWRERVALAGANGAGKSTLLRLLVGELAPQSGEVRWGKGVRLGYLPQAWDAGLDEVPAFALFSEDTQPRALTLLGCLGVSGEDFSQPLAALSEGQKRKALLARLILEEPNVLVLDEPTTHLDYRSVEMLEEALLDFGGTVILVSHDRYLRERVCGRELEVGTVRVT